MKGTQLELGLCLSSEYDADGHLGVQVDLDGDNASSLVEALLPFGFFCRPDDPVRAKGGKADPARATQCLQVFLGDEIRAMPIGDPRAQAKLPKFGKGSAGFYCPKTGGYAIFDGEKGSLYVYVPYVVAGVTKAMSIEIDVQDVTKPSLSVVHGDGMSFRMHGEGKFPIVLANRAGDAHLEVNDDGIVVNGNLKVLGSFEFGAKAGATIPLMTAAMTATTLAKGI